MNGASGLNGYALLGIVLVLYALMLFVVTFTKPKKIWGIAKIRAFEKVLGEKGTVIFFYAFGLLALGVGIWMFTL